MTRMTGVGLGLLLLVLLAAVTGMLWLLLVFLAIVAAVGLYVLVKGRHTVPTGYVGTVYRRFGPSHPDDCFKVRVHGSPGPQAATLEADRVYWLPRLLYQVKEVPQTQVPPGTIGVVMAKAGNPPPVDRMLCRHVECNFFQDGRAFLLGGGQMGRQPGILPGGASYDINPLLFEVLTVKTIGDGRHDLTAADLKEIAIAEGSTGVVIALEGAPPDEDDEDSGAVGRRVPGHQSFQLPSVFLDNGGQRGAQAETLSHGGVYRINPWFARVVIIPTRDLTLEWSKKNNAATNYDAALNQILVNIEGHRLRFDMSQTIRIPAKAAPRLVGRFGEQATDRFGSSDATNPAPVQRFVERVLGYTVEGYFQSIASKYNVLQFISAQNAVRLELEDQVRHALAEWGVEAGRTILGTFESEDTTLDEFRRESVAERERLRRRIVEEDDKHQVLELRQENVVLEEKIKRIQIETDRERSKAEVVKLEEETRIQIEAERERSKTEVAKLKEEMRILGRHTLAMERFLTQLAKMDVPEWVGGNNADALLQYMPLSVARNMINSAMGRIKAETDTTSPQQLTGTPDTRRDGQLKPRTDDDHSNDDIVDSGNPDA